MNYVIVQPQNHKDTSLVIDEVQKYCGIMYEWIKMIAHNEQEKLSATDLVRNFDVDGGSSTTIYRSGTPATPLIASISKALRLVYEDFDNKTKHVKEIHDYLIDKLKDLDIYINSNEYCVPNIVNLSLKNIKSETMLHALEQDDIYISTQTACSTGNYSKAVYSVTKDEDKAGRSIRISISYLTTKEEIDILIDSLKKNLEKLDLRG